MITGSFGHATQSISRAHVGTEQCDEAAVNAWVVPAVENTYPLGRKVGMYVWYTARLFEALIESTTGLQLRLMPSVGEAIAALG